MAPSYPLARRVARSVQSRAGNHSLQVRQKALHWREPQYQRQLTRLINYFLKGLVFLAPLAFTIYICVRIFTTIDGWLGFSMPGAGFAITVVLITMVGFLAQSFLTRGVLSMVESLLNRLPFVRLLYSSTKDLLNAFMGEKRRFDKPVMVTPFQGGLGRVFGFVTQDSLASLGLMDHVTVYLPHSYAVSGMLWIFPASAVTPVAADSAEVMAFIVSGGVTTPPASGADLKLTIQD